MSFWICSCDFPHEQRRFYGWQVTNLKSKTPHYNECVYIEYSSSRQVLHRPNSVLLKAEYKLPLWAHAEIGPDWVDHVENNNKIKSRSKMHCKVRTLTRSMKTLQSRLIFRPLHGIIRVSYQAPLTRNAALHSHSHFMEASSNVVNIYEINSISVYDLKSHYERVKAKARGKHDNFISTSMS